MVTREVPVVQAELENVALTATHCNAFQLSFGKPCRAQIALMPVIDFSLECYRHEPCSCQILLGVGIWLRQNISPM